MGVEEKQPVKQPVEEQQPLRGELQYSEGNYDWNYLPC